MRGPFASGNPAKYAFQYPRPWRMNENSQVVDTGRTDALGFPVYDSKVVVVPQLLRQRSTSPADDGGFPSGHTNAFHLAALAYAYAVPERFQELVTRAFELSHTRIISGMHSPVDVLGGRIMATALAAATLADPANADLKAAARAQALAYFTAQTGTTPDTLYAYAHSGSDDRTPTGTPTPRTVAPRLTYVLTRQGREQAADRAEGRRGAAGDAAAVPRRGPAPRGAAHDRAALRVRRCWTASSSGAGSTCSPRRTATAPSTRDVTVTLDAAAGGFGAADAWRNDIDGEGGLTKRGYRHADPDRAQHATRAAPCWRRARWSPAAPMPWATAMCGWPAGRCGCSTTRSQLHGAYVQEPRGAGADAALGRHRTVLDGDRRVLLEKGSVLSLQPRRRDPPAVGTSSP